MTHLFHCARQHQQSHRSSPINIKSTPRPQTTPKCRKATIHQQLIKTPVHRLLFPSFAKECNTALIARGSNCAQSQKFSWAFFQQCLLFHTTPAWHTRSTCGPYQQLNDHALCKSPHSFTGTLTHVHTASLSSVENTQKHSKSFHFSSLSHCQPQSKC